MLPTLPHNRDAERSVLGTLLFSESAYDDVASVVKATDFYDPRHEVVFKAVANVRANGVRADLVTVAAEIRRMDAAAKFAATGIESLLIELANESVGQAVGHHAKIVAECSTLRQLAHAADRVKGLVLAYERPADEILALAQQEIGSVADQGISNAPQPFKAHLRVAVKQIGDRYHNRAVVCGVPTGLEEFDELTAGLHPAQLVILAARPSMGKTALAMCAVLEAARLGHPALVFSEEMTGAMLAQRAISREARIDGTLLRSGLLTSEDFAKMELAVTRLIRLPIEIEDCGGNTLASLCAKSRKWWREAKKFGKPGLIVVDYLQLLSGSGDDRKPESRERAIAEISRGLKRLAKELHLPVMALSQLNRSVEGRADKRPGPADLRESGAIEQDADVIAFIYRDEVYNKESPDKGIAEIIVSKQREGDTGVVRVKFQREHTAFLNLKPMEYRP